MKFSLEQINHIHDRLGSAEILAQYETLLISQESDQQDFLHYLDLHNSGKIGYLEMSKGLAKSGVEKWVINTEKMTMIFYNKAGNKLLTDNIRNSISIQC